MKYTRSRDGVERATLLVPHRVTREEFAWLVKRAKANGGKRTPHDVLSACLSEGLENEAERDREEAAYANWERSQEPGQ